MSLMRLGDANGLSFTARDVLFLALLRLALELA